MTQEIKQRVTVLEKMLQDFIIHTERDFTKVYNLMIDQHHTMEDFKEDMQASREASAKEMKEFKEEMAKKWGDLANRLGTFAEDVVAPNIVPLAHKYFNCPPQPIDFMIRSVKTHSKDPGRVREFDSYAVYSDTVILTETKSTPRSEYINSFAQAITEFYDFFPSYTGKKLIPIFASLSVPENIIKHATRKNIYVMALKGDTMDILNYSDFQE